MKPFNFFFAMALALGLIAGADGQDAKKISDSDISKLLVGTWQSKTNEYTYKKDGTYTLRIFSINEPTAASESWAGTWKIVEGEIETVLVKTSNPANKRFEGLTFVEKIVLIDNSTLKTELQERSNPAEFKRVKN